MKNGSPGGILLIAFGVLFLRLAYTGRIGAVWQALITGEQTDDPNRWSPGTGGTCEDPNRTAVTYTGDPALKGVTECILTKNVRTGTDCDASTERKATDSNGNQVCVKNGIGGDPVQEGTKAGQVNSYNAFNAAGAPYITSAGNNAYA